MDQYLQVLLQQCLKYFHMTLRDARMTEDYIEDLIACMFDQKSNQLTTKIGNTPSSHGSRQLEHFLPALDIYF